MILQSLMQYYESLAEKGKVPRMGWCHAKVSCAVELDEDGQVKAIIPLKVSEMFGKKEVLVPQQMNVPQMVVRSSGISANFLCDNSKYMLGIDSTGTSQRIKECFMAARDKHCSILQDSKGRMAKAIIRYFEQWNPDNADVNPVIKAHWEDLTDGGNLIFCMESDYAQEDEEIKKIWNIYQDNNSGLVDGICLVTGEKAEIARIHRGIKGVPGAQSSGAALVSFNAPAFESYGKEQSYNAPVGKKAEFAYTTALNYLLSEKKYTFQLGDSMVIYWAESAQTQYQDIFKSFFNSSIDNQKELEKVFTNLKNGLAVDIDDVRIDLNQRFYILCLAPNAARLSIRFYYQNSFGNILENLSRHYERMSIVKPEWGKDYLSIQEMLMETVNKKSKDKKPVSNMATLVLRDILVDDRYPTSLYTGVLTRIRAEQGGITYGRAAIVKAYLIKNYNMKEGEKYMGLNENCNEQAYVLGRLFAILELVQKDANPGINSTIKERYFNSACATPASVFPILIKLKNSHLKKIERSSTGLKIQYEKTITELMGKLNIAETQIGFPRRLSLEEQGKFMLGYYHQIQKRYEKKEDK
ncbi:type I-C CRISPR-associated protein Cas8c/Csd1 [Coprococcus sp. AM14-16]|uniref:type I-C CRISPR-associated protein Cas8c/Csd1 n=1 Tax=Coprococcus TaxID=33042 RepID=UPI000E410A64|nr:MULTISPECIES: type I-C CRISPR-associated protein Cas8c/Csd1 [Coprococcus]RGD41320.1 type I-C CRISPR-associated protein Cas8c/Csd1 [Coprococcus sp. AM14-16]